MTKRLLLWLLLLPAFGHAQGRFFSKLFKATSNNESKQQSDAKFTYSEQRRVNTTLLFPKPPDILKLDVASSDSSKFVIKACIVNLKSVEELRLTQNGEEQPIRQQPSSPTKDDTCPNGYVFTYTLTSSSARNTISLEARNEGGATIRYLEVPAVPVIK